MFDQEEEQPRRERIALIDVSAIYWQCWHSSGEDQSASAPARATADKVRRIAERFKHVAVCADDSRSWRHDLAPDYKANREQKPPEASAQLRRALELIESDGFVIWRAKNYEADDVIASAVAWARRNDLDVVIVSADKDLMSLVEDDGSVIVESIRWDESIGGFPTYDAAGVKEKFKVHPRQIADFLAVMGDSSDNIPGIPGVGKVKAAELVNAYNDVIGIIDAAKDEKSKITPKLREAILANEAQLATSLKLTLLRTDVDLPWPDVLKPRLQKPRPKNQEAKPPPPANEKEEDMSEPTDAEFENAPPPADSGEQAAPPPNGEQQQEPQKPGPAKADKKPETVTAIVQVAQPGTSGWALALEPQNMRQAFWLAETAVNSRLYGNFTSPEAALMAIMRGRELGIPALTALSAFDVVKGKLFTKADFLIGVVQKSPLCEYVIETERTPMKSTWVAKRKGYPEKTLSYTIQEAKDAGLVINDSNWTKRPAQMLSKTCGAIICRLIWKDLCHGLYTLEELAALAEAA